MMKSKFLGLAGLLLACCTPSPPAQNAVCDYPAIVINLQSHGLDKGQCFKNGADPASCVWNEISEKVDTCTGIDIYVPGTGAEGGDSKQFSALIDRARAESRNAFVVKYQAGNTLNAMSYTDGVEDASDALKLLLVAITENFTASENQAKPDVRVFGHSKGAHAVAVVAEAGGVYDDVQYFAFGQPGKTNSELKSDLPAAPLGQPGFIEKLSHNLVGFTWENDEVQFYNSGSVGMPETVQIPGLANPKKSDNEQKSNGALSANFRWDHHNTYGGDFSEKAFPYCAAGSRNSWLFDDQCKKTETAFKPYFWGNEDCYNEAMAMMASTAGVGTRKYVGASEPRESCIADQGGPDDMIWVKKAEVKYQFNIPDKDCNANVTFEFLPKGRKIKWGHSDGAKLSVTKLNGMDSYAVKTKSNFSVPNSLRLKVRTEITEKSGGGNCGAPAAAQLKIRSLKLTFDHPDTGKETEKYLIRGASKTGWKRKKTNRDYDDMDIFKSDNAIKFSSRAKDKKHGVFYKDMKMTDRRVGNIFIDRAVVDYKFHIPDGDCNVNAVFEFLPGKTPIAWDHGGGPKLSVTKLVDMDSFDHKEKQNFYVPNHIRLKIRTEISDKKGGGVCLAPLPVQMHIKNLRFEFTHPGTNDPDYKQYIIRGQFEGDGLIGKITGQNNVAWQKQDVEGDDDMDMFNSPGSIKISSSAVAGKKGVFYKDLYLID